MAPTRTNSSSSSSPRAALPAHVLAGARDAETTARREREVQEANRNSLVGADRHDDEDDEEEEVTTDVFEVELTGGSPWATAFLECASEGDLTTVTKLLDEGKVELNDVDVDGFTALMIASAEAQTDVAMELLRRGADVSIRTHEMRSTALHFAAKSGVATVVEAICVQDPQRIDAQNLDGDTPLVWACTEGRVDAVRVLLQHNANVNVVSHRAMSALICAVMMREGDDSENEDDDEEDERSKAEDATGTDADRAEIVRVLLAKNAKLVNYQDRDGSTAMHLAASHGYIECVKALLEFGADITLRNAIGQTPVEEAEETGVPGKSDVCIEYLRVIWKRLEEEAAARMMAMLEMEESNPNASSNNAKASGKKSKKKQKKAKQRRGSKAVAANAAFSASSANVEKATTSSGEGSSDDEDEERADQKKCESKVDGGEKSTEVTESKEENVVAGGEKTGGAPDGGVWTTVGRKHNQYLSQKAAAVSDELVGNAGANGASAQGYTAEIDGAASAPKKVLPVTPRSKNQRPAPSSTTTPTPAPTPASTPRSRDERTGSAAKKVTPVTPRVKSNRPRPVTNRAPLPGSAGAYPPSSAQEPAPASTTASTVPPLPMGSPFSTFQGLYNTNRLYERYERHPETAADGRTRIGSAGAASASSLWRSTAPTATAHSYDPSFSLGYAATTQNVSSASNENASSSATIWQYTSDRGALLPIRRDVRAPDAASDKVLRFLACGLCGDLVNNNLQCNNDEQLYPSSATQPSPDSDNTRATPCVQLFCASCVARAVANRGSALHCIKCRQSIQPQKMQRNEFAHAQASALAHAARSKASQLQQQQLQQQQQRSTLEEMRYLMQRADEKVQALDIDPFYLAPGANLPALSVGQLDALEELHLTALRQITHARVENARAIERLRMEEWLKTQRDIFQYTTHTHTTAASSAASSQQPQ